VKTNKNLKLAIFFLILVAIPAVLGIGWFIYINRCHVLACTPASWETIRGLAIAHTDNDTTVESISAQSAIWNNYTESGPAFINISIEYFSIDSNESKLHGETVSHPESIEFDDQTLILHHINTDASVIGPSSLEHQQLLKKVSISPRDAIRAAWKLAQSEKSLTTEYPIVLVMLHFDKNHDTEHECVWDVNIGSKLSYFVDAQTGQVFSMHRWP
jgi:hypothetical protein